jgi:hypothetical protein
MSASSTDDKFFTGSYILASVVPDPDTAPGTEEFIGCITEGPTISKEYEEAEATLKCRDNMYRKKTTASIDVELSIAQQKGLPTLSTLGIQDPDTKKMLGPNQVPLVRVRYYTSGPDSANPSENLAMGKEFEEVEWSLAEDNAEAGELAAIQLAGVVNGDVYHTLRLGGTT